MRLTDHERTAALTNHVAPTQAHPCPDCGHCPTCGRGGRSYPTWPYNPYYPWWDRPWWNQVICSGTSAGAGAGFTSWSVTTSPGLALGDVKGVSLDIQPTANAYLN